MGSFDKDNISVMVIGAGTGGRLIAQGLRKIGIPCTIFERDLSLDQRARDWNFGIYWAQTPLDDCLPMDIQGDLLAAQVDRIAPNAEAFLPVFNGATGAPLKSIPTPFYLRMRRRALSRLLGRGLDIRYGKRLTHVDATSGPGVTATFADGTQHTASLLIGAEGAHSLVREYLLGPDQGRVLHSPVMMAMTVTKLPVDMVHEFLAIHQRSCLIFHPNGTFGWIGVHNAYDHPDDMAQWEFSFICSWLEEDDDASASNDPHASPKETLPPPRTTSSSKAIIADVKHRTAAMAPPFRRLWAAIDDDAPAWANFLPYWPTQGWPNHPARGKVTLAGDAAHPMTPHRGQGLNNAILDCRDLMHALADAMATSQDDGGGGGDGNTTATTGWQAAAVQKYEEAMWARGHEAVVSNLENSLAVHRWESLAGAAVLRDGVTQQTATRMETT